VSNLVLRGVSISRAIAAPSRRASTSDSDSDYGARSHSKKKRRSRHSAEEVRVSSRGVKVPNYVDDVQDFERYEDETEPGYYYEEQPLQEEDEIEAVFGHSRDELREDDPEDLWFENVVRSIAAISYHCFSCTPPNSDSTSNGRISRISTTQTRPTNSSSDLKG